MKQNRFEPGSFIVVPNKHALRSMSRSAKLVYIALCLYADDKGLCFPSRKTLAEDAGSSVRTVDTSLKELIKLGIISKAPQKSSVGDYTSNIYQLHIVPSEDFAIPNVQGGSATIAPPSEVVAPGSVSDGALTKSIELNTSNSLAKANGQAPEVFGNPVINEMIEIFEKGLEVKLKKKAQQRKAAWRLIKQLGDEKALAACRAALAIKDEQYAPVISDILDLDQKLGKLILFYRKHQPKQQIVKV